MEATPCLHAKDKHSGIKKMEPLSVFRGSQAARGRRNICLRSANPHIRHPGSVFFTIFIATAERRGQGIGVGKQLLIPSSARDSFQGRLKPQ